VALASVASIFGAAARAGSRRAVSRASRLTSVSNSCDCRTGLARWASNRCSASASRRPRELASTRGSAGRTCFMRRASSTPSISGMCMSRIATSNASACCSQRSASAGESVSRTCMPPPAGLQAEHAAVGGVVVDDQQAPPVSSGCVPT